MLVTILKKERQNKGLTQYQFADILNISERTYQRIENNERKPSCDVVIKLQNYFNKSIDCLLEQAVDDKK